MNTALIIPIAVFTVIISILSVQVPRYLEHLEQQKFEYEDAATPRPMTDGTTTPPRPSN
jgi:hypothetical protein